MADFYGIDKRPGAETGFTAFMQAAAAYHIRIIMDLVVNYTSDGTWEDLYSHRHFTSADGKLNLSLGDYGFLRLRKSE